jgi:hypothetical protein
MPATRLGGRRWDELSSADYLALDNEGRDEYWADVEEWETENPEPLCRHGLPAYSGCTVCSRENYSGLCEHGNSPRRCWVCS